ncbi:MAG: hypothetical protein GY757_44135 [bacterium]|nr:hypothetical protein [bacterium]
MFFKKKKQLMVIGIDGVPHELVLEFAEKGIMPNMKTLIDKYTLKKTRVPLPEISSVSWTSFMTGKNPGEHGVYGFMEADLQDYSYNFPMFNTLAAKPVWEEIGKNKSIILNLPGTYPARELNGILVSGFVAPDLGRSVYPTKLLPLLEAMKYRVDVDNRVGKSDKALFLKDLNETLGIRYELYKKIEKNEKWNLFFFIVTGTDRLHHFFFEAAGDTCSEYRDEFLEYYRRLDTIIGEMTADMEKKGIPFIILSDHGFTQIKQEVYLSQYLKEWGYLHLADEAPKNLKSMTEQTKIFALDPSRLYIHSEGKYKNGKVKKEQYQLLRKEIKEKFLALEIDGQKAIKEVFYKEDLYNGPFLNNAPDLVLLSNYGFDLKAGIKKETLYGRSHFQGMHTYDNAMLLDAHGFDLEEHPIIYDIGKNVKEFF